MNRDYLNRADNNYILAPYVERCKELELSTLTRRRINAIIMLMYKIILGRYQAPEIRQQLHINTGRRTIRNPEFIRLNFYRTDHGLNSALNTACRAFNRTALFIDPTLPIFEFKRKLEKLPDAVFENLLEL